jgi:hypothetical protein
MHPYIAMFIHEILSLNIDYTFKRVEGAMDEWEVAGFLDRFKQRESCVIIKVPELLQLFNSGLTFASLYCDRKTREAFAQLFTELFDTVRQVTGQVLKLAPFFPTANCRTIMLDGEVAQALGLADFLATYNDPEISGILSRSTGEMLGSSLKTCTLHFERYEHMLIFFIIQLMRPRVSPSHIDELPIHVSKADIARLKSILGLNSQEDIDAWHEFCAAHDDPAI